MIGTQVACVAALALAATTAAVPARADEAADHQKAAASFREARAAIAAGNCAAAMPKLEESLAYEPSVGAHLSMADCYEQVDLVATWRELQEAGDLATTKNDPRAAVARDRATALEPKLTMIRFVYAPPQADLSGLEVRVDGGVVKPLLLRRGSLATTPGAHDVEVALPHKKPWRGQVLARSAGTSVDVAVPVEDESAPSLAPPVASIAVTPALPSAPPDADASSGSTQRTAALWTGGAGIVGLALGSVFGIVALADQANLRDACGGSVKRCDAAPGSSSVTGPQDSARSAGTVSTIAFIAGGVALATGIVLFVSAPSAHQVAVGAAAGPGSASLSLAGRFE